MGLYSSGKDSVEDEGGNESRSPNITRHQFTDHTFLTDSCVPANGCNDTVGFFLGDYCWYLLGNGICFH